ncbi:hypothetical protein [Burkholderia cepacia]|nr:hypothetical protein [Burkholderia cepacia]
MHSRRDARAARRAGCAAPHAHASATAASPHPPAGVTSNASRSTLT